MLFKLSIRNIRRSLKDYTIYFFTLVLGVAIFYIFNSLESQTVMMNVSKNTHDLIALMNSVMSVLSVLVAVIFGFLVIYASRYLMKRRKKEFGIYMTLGMGKGQISRILLSETLIIGLVALVVGLIVGIALSQLTSILVSNMFEADMTSFQFVFSGSALLTTAGLFALIYLIVMIFNTISVGKQRLINLIHSDKINEKIKMRNPIACTIIFIVSVLMLAYAYVSVTANVTELTDEALVFCIILGIVGTFLLFWSLSGLILRIVMKFKNIYFRGLNMFVFREVNSKINTTVISMSIISLLLFLTIGIFSSAMSIKNSMTKNLQTLAPADFQAEKFINHRNHSEDTEIRENDGLSAKQAMEAVGINIDEYFSEYVSATVYRIQDFTYAQTVGEAALRSVGGLTDETIEIMLRSTEYILNLSDYNQLATIYNFDTISLSDNQYAVVADFDSAVKARNEALKNSAPTLDILGHSLEPKYDHVIDGILEMSSNNINTGLIIIPDFIDLAGNESNSYFIGNYKATDKQGIQKTDEDLTEKLYNVDVWEQYYLVSTTKSEIYENSIGLSALVTFIGLYLGSIFLITSAALLGLKEISESSDNQEKYRTLRELGVDQKSLNRTLLAGIGIFFGLPLVVAIIHSIFGIMFANQVILTFANVDLLPSIIMTAAFIVAIYGGYFLITYYTSKRIVMGRE